MAGAPSEVMLLFILLGGSLLAGYAGSWLFRRHRVSDIAFLLIVGAVAGPGLGLLDPAPFAPAFAALAPLALAVVLFEGGLELSWRDLRQHAGRAFATSLAVWGFTVAGVGATAALVLGWPPAVALLFALCVSATGILAVIPLLAQLRVAPATRVTLTVETSLGDLLSAVAVAAVAGMLVLGASPWQGAGLLAAQFAVGASVGVLAGLVAARMLHALEGGRHAFAVVLAIVLLAYALAEGLGGSGLLAALALGLFVGNARDLMARGGLARLAPPARDVRLHQSEVIFLLRSVYFVVLGLSLGREVFAPPVLLAGLALTAAVVGARWLAVRLSQPREADRLLLVAMMPRGLVAAVLAGLPLAMGVPGTGSFVGYAFLVILGADLATTAGLWMHGRRGGAGLVSADGAEPAEAAAPARP